MNFRNRLMLFLVVTLVAVQVFTGLVVYNVIRNHVIDQGKTELKAATEIFVRELDALSGRVSDAVDVLALDYPLRSAIAAEDHETALSALRNHGHRVGATRMMLVRLDGTVSADTLQPDAKAGSFRFRICLRRQLWRSVAKASPPSMAMSIGSSSCRCARRCRSRSSSRSFPSMTGSQRICASYRRSPSASRSSPPTPRVPGRSRRARKGISPPCACRRPGLPSARARPSLRPATANI